MAKLTNKWILDGTISEVKLDINNSPVADYVLAWNDTAGKPEWISAGAADAHDVKVSANDTTPGFLEGKLLADSGKTTVVVNNDGANETITLGIGADILDTATMDTDNLDEGSTNKYYTDAKVDTYLDTQKGVVNGIAELDGNGLVPADQLPISVMDFKGTFGSAGSTTGGDLPSTGLSAGDVYISDEDGFASTEAGQTFDLGDWALYNGTTWNKIDNTDAVTSVNGATGAVVLGTDNINEGSTNLYYTDTRARAALSAGDGIDYNSTTGVITGQTKKVEILTLDGTDITNKYKDLAETPKDASAVELTPVGGIPQRYGVDYTVVTDGATVKRVNWSGLGIDGVIASGDILLISYTY